MSRARHDPDPPTPETTSLPQQPPTPVAPVQPAPVTDYAGASSPAEAPSVRRTALYIAGVYFVVGCLWILLSDNALEWAMGAVSADLLTWAQTYKGWFFVAATAALLYVLTIRGLRQVRQGQRAVAEGERRLRGVVDSNVVGICFWRIDGCVLEANAAYLDLVGYDDADVRAGRVCWRAMTPARFEPLDQAAVDEAIARGVSEPYEKEYVRKDGRHVPVLVRLATLPGGDRDVGVAAVVDISQRKHAEEQARRLNAELEDAARVKDQFLAVLSHELRTPITSIRLWTQLLRAADADPAVSGEALAMIEQGVESQTRLINDLLDVSRIVAGHLRIEARPADLRPIIESAAAALEPAAREEGLEFDVELAGGPLAVLGDEQRLRQIVWNLLSNAIKFTPAGGRVTVSLRALPGGGPGGVAAGRCAVLVVSDTGIGIDAAFMPRLFESFRQADGSTTRRHGGLGIGLSIVKRLVELQGGTIRAESPGRGRGATFTVELPIAAGVTVPNAAHASSGDVVVAVATAPATVPDAAATVATAAPLAPHTPDPIKPRSMQSLDTNTPVTAEREESAVTGRTAAAIATTHIPAATAPSLPAAPNAADGAPAASERGDSRPAHEHLDGVTAGSDAGPRTPLQSENVVPATPVAATPQAPPSAPEQEPEVLAGVRVMVVDDHEETCRAVARLLRSHGATVLTAHAVEPALRLLDSTTPDVLVSDIGLPDADGHDLIRAIRARETASRRNGAERHLCAIALTAYAMPEDRHRALAAGFDDYLSKPIDFNELLDKVRALAPATTAER